MTPAEKLRELECPRRGFGCQSGCIDPVALDEAINAVLRNGPWRPH